MKRSFLKRSLLLSAASVPLLPFPALAVNPVLTISSATTTAVKTSTAVSNAPGDITINANGSITIKQAGPAVKLDSSNAVQILGTISNKDTTNAQGIVIDTGTHTTASTADPANPNTITGSLSVIPSSGDINNGGVLTINLTGSGTNKQGLEVIGNGKFGGDINFGNSLLGLASMSIQGNQSTGILVDSTAIVNGNLNIDAEISMTPTTANDTSASTGISAVNIAGTITKNVLIDTGSQIVAWGNGSVGVVSSGLIQGSFTNSGTIAVSSFQSSQNQSTGVATVPKGSGDPIGGPAMVISGSILKGFMNSGPDGTTSTTTQPTGVITSDGGGAGTPLPILYISPGSTAPLEIGVFGDTTTANPGYSFYNRGNIGSSSNGTIDPNLSVAGVLFTGTSSTADVLLDGKGFFNSGTISAAGHTTSSGSNAITVVGLGIGSVSVNDTAVNANGGFVHVGDPTLKDAQNNPVPTGIYNSGTIQAIAQGDLGGVAIGIDIGSTSVVQNLTNTGVISATAHTNNPATVQTEVAYAINDQSGTLSHITNLNTIQASATSLTTPGLASTQVAANFSNNTTGVTFINGDSTHAAQVGGDINFGNGVDTLTVTGPSPPATAVPGTPTSRVIGNINFGGVSNSFVGQHDSLTVNNNGYVAGQIREQSQGQLDVTVAGAGRLDVLNNSANYGSLLVNDLHVNNNGTLNIAVSTVLPGNISVDAGSTGTITLDNGANLGVIYSSFVPASGQFVLLQAAAGSLNISNAEFGQIKNSIDTNIPFLFNSNGGLSRVVTVSKDQLVLNLTPKTASQLGLTGYAEQMFPYVNVALENDDVLGAAVIKGITSNATAQTAYSQFAPDASGGTRAIAISLTDHATGPVAARQRALRLYATQPGDLTLWGQEFAQQISDKGSDGLPGFKDSGFGFAVGADGGDALGGWYGGAFTFYTGNVDQRAPASSRDNTQWYMLSGYSTWRGKGLFLDTQLTAGYGDLSAHRFIAIGDATAFAVRQTNSKHASELASVGMTTGANLVYGSTTITPNIALDAMTMREEGYTETGGGGTTGDGFDLKVNPVVMGSLRGFVGVNARQDVNFGSFFMQPELRVGYRYDFLADRIDLTASFPGVTSTGATGPGTGSFTITGPQPTKGNLLAGASVATTTGAWSIGLNYDMLSGTNGSMTQVGTISLVGRI